MTLSDGKLITLTNHVTVAASKQQVFPLDKLPYYFPIPPTGDLTRGGTAQHSERNVIRRGTVSQFGGPDLEEISWDGEWLVGEWFGDDNVMNNPSADLGDLILDDGGNLIRLPNGNFARKPRATHDPFAFFPSYFLRPPKGYAFYSAIYAYSILKEIRDRGHVVLLRIQDLNTGQVETNMPVTLRTLRMTEKPGEPDTRFYNITFRQYRWLQIREVDRAGGTSGTGGAGRPSNGRFVSSPFKTDKQYHIKALSTKAYHNASKGSLIIEANGGVARMKREGKLLDVINPTPRSGMYKIPKGVSLNIPPLPTSSPGIGTVPPGTKPPV